MYRVFCTIALILGVTALVGLQTAMADWLPATAKDSAEFSYKYEMAVDPTGQDLTGTPTGVDWGLVGTASLSVLGDGTTISTIGPDAGYYRSFASAVPGAVMASSDVTFTSGWTAEMRIKTATSEGNTYSIDLEMGEGISAEQAVAMQVYIGDTQVYWRNADAGGVVTAANNDDFHTWRIAQRPGVNEYAFWRDGVQLFSDVTLAGNINEGEAAIYLGLLAGGTGGATQIDYFRMTSGAYAPIPEPGTSVLLATGMLGLLAYAWRKRK